MHYILNNSNNNNDNNKHNQSENKRIEFRKTIRRRQIQQYFQNQRVIHADKVFQQDRQQIKKILSSPESKVIWLQAKAQQLGTFPKKQWWSVLKELTLAAESFSQGFELWGKFGLIGCVGLLLRPEYRQLQLYHISACILQQIISTLPVQSPQIQQIIGQQIIKDLIDLYKLPQSSIISLINTILYKKIKLRNIFINQGFTQLLVIKLSKQTNIERDQVYIMLCVVFRLIKSTCSSCKPSPHLSNIILVLIPILAMYTVDIKNKASLRVLLKIFASITSSSKQYILSKVFQSENLIDYLLFLITAESDPVYRSFTSNILANISSSANLIYCEILIKKKILDKIIRCNSYENNHQQCINSLLKILYNIVSNSLQQSKQVIYHKIFQQFVIFYAKKTDNQMNHTDAINIISTLIEYNNKEIIEFLIKKIQILSVFMQSLQSHYISIDSCLKILQCLIQIISLHNDIYGRNKISDQLESIYGIVRVLEDLQQNIKNKDVENYVSVLIQLIYGQ